MSDQVRFETEHGAQPSSSGGERILVGLALLVLLGAVIIVAGKLLPTDETAVLPSESPRPSSTPRATAQAVVTPPPGTFVLDPAPSPVAATPAPQLFFGWIRARSDLVLHASPALDAASVGTLAAGEAVEAYEDGSAPPGLGWLSVNGATTPGWIATREGGVDRVDRYAQGPTVVSGWVGDIVGGDGFMSLAQPSGTSDAYPPTELIESADGVAWHPVAMPDPNAYTAVLAYGPAGWLAALAGDRVTIARSSDRSTWELLGSLPTDGASSPIRASGLQALVGSDAGYLLVTSVDRARQSTVWHSMDGVRWDEVRPGISDVFNVAATPAGFYAWADAQCCLHSAAFSVDGVTWSAVTAGPTSPWLHLAALNGDQLLAVEAVPGTGEPRAWVGQLNGDTLSWTRYPAPLSEAGDAVVTAMTTTPAGPVAFGFDRLTEATFSWIPSASGWLRMPLPRSFEGFPTGAAADGDSVVILGHHPSIFGGDPVIWHRALDGSWAPAPEPVIAAAGLRSPADCPPIPRDAISWLIVDHSQLIACHGSKPITFRAWSQECGGCFGQGSGTYQVGWLAAPEQPLLLTGSNNNQSSSQWAILDPSLGATPPSEWIGTWLRVTGHFDDPAAAGCRFNPAAEELASYAGTASVVNGCRLQFVVTAVTVVDGP